MPAVKTRMSKAGVLAGVYKLQGLPIETRHDLLPFLVLLTELCRAEHLVKISVLRGVGEREGKRKCLRVERGETERQRGFLQTRWMPRSRKSAIRVTMLCMRRRISGTRLPFSLRLAQDIQKARSAAAVAAAATSLPACLPNYLPPSR